MRAKPRSEIRKRSPRREAPRIGRPLKFDSAMGTVSLRLPAEMLATLGRIADGRRARVSDVIRELLGEALAANGGKS